MLKLLGGLLILLCGGCSALFGARRERARLAVLDAWIDLLFFIRTQIDCYLTPIDTILATADTEMLRAAAPDFRARSLPALLRAAAPYLSDEARRLLEGWSRELGSGYREEQIKRCDYYLEALRGLRERSFAELPSRIKLSVTLSLSAAIGVAILLW